MMAAISRCRCVAIPVRVLAYRGRESSCRLAKTVTAGLLRRALPHHHLSWDRNAFRPTSDRAARFRES